MFFIKDCLCVASQRGLDAHGSAGEGLHAQIVVQMGCIRRVRDAFRFAAGERNTDGRLSRR
jgi:hypothetical protein